MRNYTSVKCKACGREFAKTGPRSVYCSGECKPYIYNLTCEWCGKEFGSRKNPGARYCSREHMVADGGHISENTGRPLTKGKPGFHPYAPEILRDAGHGEPSSWLDDRGYISYYWPDHPAAPKGSRIAEHRAIAYEIWGDEIKGMDVDHINGDKRDNDPKNLQLLTKKEHAIKTAVEDGSGAFWLWVQKNRPDVIDEWLLSKTV